MAVDGAMQRVFDHRWFENLVEGHGHEKFTTVTLDFIEELRGIYVGMR